MSETYVRQKNAQRQVREFARKFGPDILHLAYHAALPVVLNAELLHLLRINFFLDSPEALPYTAETDLLLSPLCRESGDDLYEIDSAIRNVLLRGLVTEYGHERIRQIAALLWQYSERSALWKEQVRLERAQQLTALNFLDPEKARGWLEEVEESWGQSVSGEREWFVAMRREMEQGFVLSNQFSTDVGSEKLLRVIRFDYLNSPTKHGWDLIEGREQDLLSYRDIYHGRILRIKAKQDFCMDYHVGLLQRTCKAIGFVVRSESNFAFYAIIKVRGRQIPDEVRLYCSSDIEGSYPEQHPEYPNEYKVYVPVDWLEEGWVRMKIDLSRKVRQVAAIKDKDWEFNGLLTLRLKGSGVEIDVARIDLYRENPWLNLFDQILIVEDDVDLAEMLDTLFQDLGYKVSTTRYGEEALVLCEERMPEVVILDIDLPGMDGYEVCRRLRNNPVTRHIAVILLSQRTLKSDRLLGLELGAVDYITKPFDTEELTLRVQNIMRGIQHKRLMDEVTGLPKGRLIEDQFRSLLRREKWALMYMGISGFGAFKETHGLESAKEVLRMTASILLNAVEELGTVDDFVGHVGEDDFVVITIPTRAQALMDKIKGDFKSTLKDLGTAIEYERAIENGEQQDAILLLDLFIGLLTGEERAFVDVRELAEVAAQARRQVESLQREMAQHRKNLDRLEEQKAKYGRNVPLDVSNAIDQEKAEIARIEALLAGREVPTSVPSPVAPSPSLTVVHGDVVYGDKVGGHAVGGDKIDTGGGAYIGGDVKVEGGDFVGRDKVTVTRTGPELDEVAALFQQALELARAPQRPPEEREDLEAAVEMAQQETEKGEEADTSLLNKALNVLLEKGPDVLEIVLEAILNPTTVAGKGARMLAREAKKSLEKRRKGSGTAA